MPIWRNAMDWLGLGPDDAYDDYEYSQEPERPSRSPRNQRDEPPQRGQRSGHSDYEPDGTVRTMPTRPSFPTRDADLTGRRPVPANDDSNVQPRPINPPRQPQPRSPQPVSSDPHTVRPRRFDSAQEIADKFKDGQPVIMNLESSDREVSRRLIDFASGLCYGLNGTMEKVATGVYLLKPLPPRKGGYESGEFDS
jgi:cell division inhibitor SepF